MNNGAILDYDIESIDEYQFNRVFIKVGRKVQLDWFKEITINAVINYAKFGFDFETLLPAKDYNMEIIEKTSKPDMTHYEVLKIVRYKNKVTKAGIIFLWILYNGKELFIPLCLVLNAIEVNNRVKISRMVFNGVLERI